MKTIKQILKKIKEKSKQLDKQNYISYSERRNLSNWINILKWVLK
jgi:ABC-type antimicrobial peptide transport system permease subunit